jgi:HAD superfamily hydrolase (TIGR01509 family)
MKGIIFDMDGLMIDSEKLYFATGREIAAAYGKTVEDPTFWKMMGRSPIDSMTIFVEEVGLPVSPQDALLERDRIMSRKLAAELEPMPGLMETLQTLRERYRLAIATGSPAKFLDVVVDSLQLASYFDVLQSSDDIRNGKPHPEIYERAAARLDLTPSECCVLEDSSNGALAGKKAGCYVIAVPNEHTREQDFSFVDFLARDLREAARHLEKTF